MFKALGVLFGGATGLRFGSIFFGGGRGGWVMVNEFSFGLLGLDFLVEFKV